MCDRSRGRVAGIQVEILTRELPGNGAGLCRNSNFIGFDDFSIINAR